MTQLFLSTKEVAEFLDVNEKMVYTLISDKGLPATKVTGKWRFPKHLVEKWLEQHIVNHPEPALEGASSALLIFAGSNDLLLERTLSLFNQTHPDYLAVFGNVGSMGGIQALNKGLCHVASSHLMQDDGQEYNFDFVPKKYSGQMPVLVNFARREQGLIVGPGNPLGIKKITDLVSKGAAVANRPQGTGTRLLFDSELSKAGIAPGNVKGYDREFRSHMEVALDVSSGTADAGMAIRPAAKALGLEFIPMRWERFDLLISRDRFFDRGIQMFLGLLQEPAFRDIASSLGGYDLEQCGKIVYPNISGGA